MVADRRGAAASQAACPALRLDRRPRRPPRSIRSHMFLTNRALPCPYHMSHPTGSVPFPFSSASAMAFVLGENNHGKGRVRLLKVRAPGVGSAVRCSEAAVGTDRLAGLTHLARHQSPAGPGDGEHASLN